MLPLWHAFLHYAFTRFNVQLVKEVLSKCSFQFSLNPLKCP